MVLSLATIETQYLGLIWTDNGSALRSNSTQRFSIQRAWWENWLTRNARSGFTAICTATARKRIRSSTDATPQLMEDSWAGLLLGCFPAYLHRRPTYLTLKTAGSRSSPTRLALAGLWLGSSSRLRIHSHLRQVSSGMISEMTRPESLVRRTILVWAVNFVIAYWTFIMSGSKFGGSSI